MKIRNVFYSVIMCILMISFGSYLAGCGSSSSTGGDSGGSGDNADAGGASGSTLSGTVVTFTAALGAERKSLYAQIKDFLLPAASAQTSDVTVTVGDAAVTTDSHGSFTITDVPVGNQTVTFAQGSSTATYALADIVADETFTLNDINVDGTAVSTAHTGTWTGTMIMDSFTGSPVEVELTLIITAGGNSISGDMFIDEEGFDEVGTFSGTETGTVLDARWTNTAPDAEGCILAGPLTGTFDGDTLTGNEPIDESTCGVEPGDDDPDSHPFTLTKS